MTNIKNLLDERKKEKKGSIKDLKDQSSIQFINDLNIFHLKQKL